MLIIFVLLLTVLFFCSKSVSVDCQLEGLGDICTERPLGYVSSTYPEGPEGTVCGSVIQEQKPYYVHILSPSYKEGFISWTKLCDLMKFTKIFKRGI